MKAFRDVTLQRRIDSWLKCAKRIIWSSLADAFAAGIDMC